MQGFRRKFGLVLVALGVGAIAWAIVVWQWQDPFTGLYTRWQQHRLGHAYTQRERRYTAPAPAGSLAAERRLLALAGERYRRTSRRGDAIGRISIPRMGIDMVLVNGTDHGTLEKGPGRDLRSYMPGENRLVYVAGHRTTYLAPFSHIDRLRRGDRITIRVPYGTFVYAVVGHRIVRSDDLNVLRSPKHEQLELQACHPRFFASHRYIAYARLVRVAPRNGQPFSTAQAAAATG